MTADKIYEFINHILKQQGYILRFEETYPSSKEDMYEVEFWLEDRNINRIDMTKVLVKEADNYRDKAFNYMLNGILFSYYSNIIDKHGSSKNN